MSDELHGPSEEWMDKLLICLECGAEFEFCVEQQREYAERGYVREPKRCRNCRGQRRDAHPAPPPPADRPQRPGPTAGRFYSADCTECGARTRVPFRPIEGRPVYCHPCHQRRQFSEPPQSVRTMNR